MTRSGPSRREVLAGILGLAGAGFAAGCSGAGEPPAGAGSTLFYAIDAQPAAGGVDPFRASNLPSRRVLSLVYDSLLSRGPDGRVAPGLATSFTHRDFTEFTFRIRPGVRFADGTPLTGDDVAYTLRAVAGGTSEAKLYLGDVESIRATATTVTVALGSPNPALLNFLADPKACFVVNARAYDAATDEQRQRTSFGTAAFTLGTWSDGNYLHLDRNPRYWETGRPRIDRIAMQVVPDETTRLSLVQQQTVDMAWFADAQLAVQAEALSYRRADPVPTQGINVYVNPTSGPLADRRVRQAVSCALDRRQLIDVAMQGDGALSFASAPGTPGVADPSVDTPFHRRDVERARQLLAASAHPSPSVALSYFSDSVTNQQPVYALMQQQLADAGIDLVLRPTPLAAMSPVFTSGAPFTDLAAVPWSYRSDPAFYFTSFLAESGALNHWAGNPDAERARRLLATAMTTTDETARSALFDQLNREVAENVLIIVPMCVPERVEVWRPDVVGGYVPDPLVTRRNLKEATVARG
ncbi:ABC transporter substrate-binding protein [Pseudonocardia sp. HH130630-07]|uniref:ABC transporter substrate-binding protein n=1 Tax=Pseudonocardia sp. HH130630-07 TaxID=1690815 RepID=UPI0008153C0C|nr:ABC transporter substrate-binding protein [Pseudonocardia sp. HH130630-07]ANY09316.1 hypothetical protein AFB00_27165 [Pseudonocardia sp. HH130630-07]